MNSPFPRVELLQTEQRRLHSTLLGKEYRLDVLLPEDYDPHLRYPVIYLLDGDVAFGMACTLTPGLYWSHLMPAPIVVGISMGSQNYQDWGQARELDFRIPELNGAAPDSHGDRFFAAIQQEFIPYIESNYPVDPGDRTLWGYSSGGFFVLYALCQEPGLFRRYLSGAGILDLACPYLLEHDQKLAGREKAAPIDIYISVGGLEDYWIPAYHELLAAIQKRNYPGVRLLSEIYENEGHGSWGLALSYLHGLQKCFQEK